MKRDFRMVEMQIMNIVNIGIAEGVAINDIRTLGEAIINATQLFLTDNEISSLRQNLIDRLKKQKIIV